MPRYVLVQGKHPVGLTHSFCSKSRFLNGWEAGIRTPIRRSRVYGRIPISLVCLVLSRTPSHRFVRFSVLNVAKLLPSFRLENRPLCPGSNPEVTTAGLTRQG